MFRKYVLVLVLAFSAFSSSRADPAPTSGAEIVRGWLESQKGVKSIVATFRQERRLRTLKRVLASEGRFWFEAPDKFRWEVGSPASLIALQSGDGKVTVVEPKKNRATIYDPDNPEHREMVQRLGLMKPGFGGGAVAFEKVFEVRGVTSNPGSPVWEAELGFKDSKMGVAVMRVIMRVNGESGVPVEFRLEFRDGTKIGWLFGNVAKDGAIEDGVFEIDLDGFEVKE